MAELAERMLGPFAGVAASFAGEEVWRSAAQSVCSGRREFEAYSPVADEETLREMRHHSPKNPVRLWTLLGGIFGGVVVAFCMVIWMSKDWPLVVGGKPIVSWPPFICICFEMTVLYASFACVISFLAQGGLPHLTLPAVYQAEFGVDRFGLFVPCREEEVAELAQRFEEQGAERVWPVYNPPRGRLAEPQHVPAIAGLGPEGRERPEEDAEP